MKDKRITIIASIFILLTIFAVRTVVDIDKLKKGCGEIHQMTLAGLHSKIFG
jgi:hypothetical protein